MHVSISTSIHQSSSKNGRKYLQSSFSTTYHSKQLIRSKLLALMQCSIVHSDISALWLFAVGLRAGRISFLFSFHMTAHFTIFSSKISWLVNFICFRNADRRILRLYNCVIVGRAWNRRVRERREKRERKLIQTSGKKFPEQPDEQPDRAANQTEQPA